MINTLSADDGEPFNLSGYDSGYYLIKYHAVDTLGNVETENVPEIPGFSTLLILSLLGLITLILVRRYKK